MKVRVEYAPVLENEVVLRCPRLDQEMLRVLSLVRSGLQKLCVWDENREIILLSPDETLYCESVDEHTFLYTASAFYQTALTLAELEGRYGELGYLRVSKSAVINLHRIRSLKSRTSGRIEASLRTGSGWWSPGTTRPCCGSGWDYKKEVHHGRIYPFLQLGPVHEISYGCLYPGAGLFQGHLQRPGRRGLRILAHHAPDAAGLHGGGHSGVLPFPGGPGAGAVRPAGADRLVGAAVQPGVCGRRAGPGLVFQCAALGRHLPGALPGVGLVRHVVRPPCGPAAGHPLPEPEAERVPEAGTGELEKKEDGCPLGETSVLFFLIRSL